MKTTSIKIYTADNLELAGLLREPDQGSKQILIHVHGMAGNFYENKFYEYISNTLTESGIAFLSFNNRGCEYIKDLYKVIGEKRTIVRIGDTYERFDDCPIDIKAAIDFAQQKGFSNIHLSGHSLGGPKVAYYASTTKDERLKSVIFLSPADMVGLAKMDKDYEVDMKMAKEMIASGKGHEIIPKLIWGESYLSAHTYMDFSEEDSKIDIFNLYNKKNELSKLSSLSIPNLTIMGRKDGALSVPVEELMDRLKKDVPLSEQIILGDANHQYDGYQQELAEGIRDWIKKYT